MSRYIAGLVHSINRIFPQCTLRNSIGGYFSFGKKLLGRQIKIIIKCIAYTVDTDLNE